MTASNPDPKTEIGRPLRGEIYGNVNSNLGPTMVGSQRFLPYDLDPALGEPFFLAQIERPLFKIEKPGAVSAPGFISINWSIVSRRRGASGI